MIYGKDMLNYLDFVSLILNNNCPVVLDTNSGISIHCLDLHCVNLWVVAKIHQRDPYQYEILYHSIEEQDKNLATELYKKFNLTSSF